MDTDASLEPPSSERRTPTSLFVAAAAVAVEGMFATVFGAAEALNTHAARAAMGVTTALFFIAFGLGLLFCSAGLVRVRAWARGPVMLTQLMTLGLAWNFRGGQTTWISVVLTIPSVIGLIAMLQPATIAALND